MPRDGARRPDDTPPPASDTPTFADAVEHFDQTSPPDDDERTQIFRPPQAHDETSRDAEPSDQRRDGLQPDARSGRPRPRPPADRAAARARRRRQIRRRRIVALAVIAAIVVLIVVLVVRGCGGQAGGEAATEAVQAVMACVAPDWLLPVLMGGQ